MRAAIGFTYDVSENSSLSVTGKGAAKEEEEEEDIDSDSDSDVSFSEIDLGKIIGMFGLNSQKKVRIHAFNLHSALKYVENWKICVYRYKQVYFCPPIGHEGMHILPS